MKKIYENIEINWHLVTGFKYKAKRCFAKAWAWFVGRLDWVWLRAKGPLKLLWPYILAVVTLALSYKQLARVVKQNGITTQQLAHTKTEDVRKAKVAEAAFKYQEIVGILNNPNSSVHAQIFALQNFPSAMCASVPERKGKKNFPNAVRLRKLLLLYLRAERSFLTDKTDRHAEAGLSSEILKLLHKLGPPSGKDSKLSIWNLKERSDGKCPGVRKDTQQYDLRHMKSSDFVAIKLPYLFQDIVPRVILFPDSADFGGGDFTDADLTRCHFVNATFRTCVLDGTKLPPATEGRPGPDYSGSIRSKPK